MDRNLDLRRTTRAGNPVVRHEGSDPGTPGSPEAQLIRLQRTAGNRAAVAALNVQRDDLDGGVALPGGLSSETSTERAPDPARQKIDRALRTMDFLEIDAITDFGPATDAERLRMIAALATVHQMIDLERDATRRLWMSFGGRLAVVASEQSVLWDLCQSKGATLPSSWLGTGVGNRTVKVSEQVGANMFGVTGAYEYRVTTDSIVITVGMNFQPDRGVSVPTSTWFGFINSTWNHFSAVNQADPTQRKKIELRPVTGRGHEIQVSAGTGRANAGHYYAADPRASTAVPHEFGHLIGLEDEYERDRPDYERVTGQRVPAGSGDAAGATTIAQGLRNALYLGEKFFEWHSTAKRRRMRAVEAVLAANHIVADYQRGENPITHEVAQQYRATYGVELSADVAKKVDGGDDEFSSWREKVVGTFQYTNTSIMGDMSEHTHPVAARHVRAFSNLVQGFLGGSWVPMEDH